MCKQTINETEANRISGWIFEMKDQNKAREEKIRELKSRNNVLQDSVEEFMDNNKKIDELKSEKKEDQKLLDTLISFAEKSSGKDFQDNGVLFRNGGQLPEEP